MIDIIYPLTCDEDMSPCGILPQNKQPIKS